VTGAPEPGWHPDPYGHPLLRWWDGSVWTEHTHEVEGRSALTPDPMPTPGPATAPIPAQAPPPAPYPAPTTTPGTAPAPVMYQPEASDPGWVARKMAAREHQRVLAEAEQLRVEVADLRRQLVATEDAVLLQEAGLYSYRHPLHDALAYKARLADVQDKMKAAVRQGQAIQSASGWTVNGSTTEGQKMVTDFSKLMIGAYNAEADSLVRALKPHGLARAIERLDKVATRISKLGRSMSIAITEYYHQLRIYELELTADYASKAAEEKEREREERARLREEEKVRREIAKAKEKLAKEAEHRRRVLETLRAGAASADEIARAEAELSAVEDSIEGLSEREANTRAGYVYVISNVGAFGPGVVKVGMTRRLEPMDRIRELGDASVPFRYDVHAIVFSNDAVGLEGTLHRALADHRLNQVNLRREFFFATPSQVRALLEGTEVNLLEFVEEAEALEWHQSQHARGLTTAPAAPAAPATADLASSASLP